MKIEWTYLPNVRPYIVDGSVWPRQREDGTWVLSALLSDGSNFSGRNEGTRSDITAPINTRLSHHPAKSGINTWEWRRNFTFADREDFKDACTPRPPKAEWFEKWNTWRVTDKDGRMFYLGECKYIDRSDGYRIDGYTFDQLQFSRRVGDSIAQPPLVLPVDLQGMPVGWKVVGE